MEAFLVLANALDLAVKSAFRIDGLSGGSHQPVDKPELRPTLRVQEGVPESRILGKRLQSGDLVEAGHSVNTQRPGALPASALPDKSGATM
jgi:hypothetical protein